MRQTFKTAKSICDKEYEDVIFLSIYLSVCQYIHLSIWLSVCLSIYLSIIKSNLLRECRTHLHIYDLSIQPPIHLSICLSIYLHVQVNAGTAIDNKALDLIKS